MKGSMEHNPFAPPTAVVKDVPARRGAATPYLAVSLLKLAVLSICTLTLYELYWFYRQWRSVKAGEGGGISPFWRAFFAVIFCYALFRRVRESGT